MVQRATVIQPEAGQLVYLRNRLWVVQDVVAYTPPRIASPVPAYRVLLECLDDDQMGRTLSVIWDKEISPQIYDAIPLPMPQGWDAPETFEALLDAVRWSSSSRLDTTALQAPFHAAVEFEEYQLEPVVRALTLPRVNLLIADDVGLGKTIEAGLVLQEMIARRRIRKILIVCPASLQMQWRDEMREKFQLDFQIVDRDNVLQLRREYGIHVNPWAAHPRIITSMDFLKREVVLNQFRETIQTGQGPLRDWDMLILDEAHNAAPSGRVQYAVDSDRTRMLRAITDAFEHRLFLTATPHNGFTESFTALLELLDPLRFTRGPIIIDPARVQRVMVRRMKDQVKTSFGRRRFPRRSVVALQVTPNRAERTLLDTLNQYTESRLSRVAWAEAMPVRFALTMLKKRLLSSANAFRSSLSTHLSTLGAPEAPPDTALVERIALRAGEDYADDREKSLAEEDALTESTRFFTDLTSEERDWLNDMKDQAAAWVNEGKLNTLTEWIDARLRPTGHWNSERLVVFTEYKDTLDALNAHFSERYGKERITLLYGGLPQSERETIKQSFNEEPSQNPIRILLATDAASEGLNLQSYCRYLIHYEIPWNPNRMEQRNGRIDRHGQPADEVSIFHFVYTDHADSQFLQVVIDKVQQIRADLGSQGDVIAAQVEEAMLGKRRVNVAIADQRQSASRQMLAADLMTEQDALALRREYEAARRDMNLTPAAMARLLNAALRLHDNQIALRPANDPTIADRAFRLDRLPAAWHAHESSLRDAKGRLLYLTFEPELARDRHDVALIHLSHPLMRLAISTFRARLWEDNPNRLLRRVSYRVLPNHVLSRPVAIAFGRMTAVSAASQSLHEAVITVGGEIDGQRLLQLASDDIRELLVQPATSPRPALPRTRADDLRALWPRHEKTLTAWLTEAEAAERARLTVRAAEVAREESNLLKGLIDERIKEIDERIRKEERNAAVPEGQLTLFDMDELRQYEDDTRWLRIKRDQLRQRIKTEPDAVLRAGALKSARVFPLAVLFLLPQAALRE